MENTAMEERIFSNGEIIFKQGTYQSEMYTILQGKVGIYADYGTQQEKKLTELTAGEFFGEMGMIECYPRSATAVALDDETKIQVITPESFQDFFRKEPEKIFAIMKHLGKRIRGLSQDYLDACRTVAESVETERKGTEKSGWLKANLKKFADAYAESMKLAAEYGADTYHGLYIGIWH